MGQVTELPRDEGPVEDDPLLPVAPRNTSDFVQRLMWVLWPAFLFAGIAEGIVFTLVDPHDIHLWDDSIELSRTAIYTLGFFFFWAITTASSALTVFLAKSPWEVNRCPLPADARPMGCPKRDDGSCERCD